MGDGIGEAVWARGAGVIVEVSPAEVGPDDAVDVDGIAGVFSVPVGEVLGVAGEEVVQLVGVEE